MRSLAHFVVVSGLSLVTPAAVASSASGAPLVADSATSHASNFSRDASVAVSGGVVAAGDGALLEASATVFFAPRWSVGLAGAWRPESDLGSSPSSASSVTRRSQYLAALSLGYAVPLGNHVSFWPQLGAMFAKTHDAFLQSAVVESGAGGAGSLTTSTTTIMQTDQVGAMAWLPITLHPNDSLFVAIGPAAFVAAYTRTTASRQPDFGLQVSSSSSPRFYPSLRAQVGARF